MEPMLLGSPGGSPTSSPDSSPVSNKKQYLPPIVMDGLEAALPHNNTLSLTPAAVSLGPSPSHTPQKTGTNRLQLLEQQPQQQQQLSRATSTCASVSATAVDAASDAPNTSQEVGSPTLFDLLRNKQPYGTPQLGMLQTSHLNSTSYNLSQTCQLNNSYLSSGPLGVNISSLIMPYTPKSRFGNFWVTIFGFSPGASAMILQHFNMCGTIVSVVHAPQNGNWMHLRYSSRIECNKALNYNLKVIAGNVMVGVTRCLDENIMDKENTEVPPGTETEVFKPKLGLLAQRHVAQHDTPVSASSSVPQASTGLVHRAMNLIFRW